MNAHHMSNYRFFCLRLLEWCVYYTLAWIPVSTSQTNEYEENYWKDKIWKRIKISAKFWDFNKNFSSEKISVKQRNVFIICTFCHNFQNYSYSASLLLNKLVQQNRERFLMTTFSSLPFISTCTDYYSIFRYMTLFIYVIISLYIDKNFSIVTLGFCDHIVETYFWVLILLLELITTLLDMLQMLHMFWW